MTRSGRRLIEDFLLPALNEEKYGDLLKWIDREKGLFCIRWSHKNAAKWTLADTAVFQDWDRLKGHFKPQMKGYYMQAKQRFRAALYKLSSVMMLECDDKHVKIYQLLRSNEKKKSNNSARSKSRTPKKEENRKSIPTSVICKNTSYIGTPAPAYSEPASPSPSSPESESDKEMQKVFAEYTQSQKKQMRIRHPKVECPDTHMAEESSPMKEHNPSEVRGHSQNQRIPHIPIQPAPMYNNIISVYDTHQKRFESPQILLVKTYHELDEGSPTTEVPFEIDCVKKENDDNENNKNENNENENNENENDENEANTYMDALNLCVKSDSESR